MEVELETPFHTFNNTDILFAKKEPTWSSYTTADTLSITKRVEFINKKEFAKVALDE